MFNMIISRVILSIFCLLIIEQQVFAEYTVEEFIDDTAFIPGAKITLTIAYKAWSIYNQFKGMSTVNGTQISKELKQIQRNLGQIGDELKAVSSGVQKLSSELNDVQSTVVDNVEIDLPTQGLLYSRIDNFRKNIRQVDKLFEFMDYIQHSTQKLETSTIDDFVKKISNQLDGQLATALDTIYTALTARHGILNILVKKHLANSLVCRDGVSPLYKINALYGSAMKAFTKGMIMNQFAYAYQREKLNQPDSFKAEMELMIRNSYAKTFKIVENVKIMMSRTSGGYWICDDIDFREGETYAKLGPIFQKYILKEQDAHSDKYYECSGTCEKRKNLVITDKCRTHFCKAQTECSGVLVDCEPSYSQMSICLADPTSGRRYNNIEVKDKRDKVVEVFGKQSTCQKKILAHQKDYGILTCEFCKCTCVNQNQNMDRHFSLKNVTSDINNNKVVTGVRFAKKNYIFHIQIEEATLLKNGVIDQNSTTWKPVDDFSIKDEGVSPAVDYHTIKWKNRTVHLDDLVSTGDSVLTGLRFKLVQDALELEVQVTPFDFDNGKLDISKSTWIFNNMNISRTEVNMRERELPEPNKYLHLDSQHNQFLEFMTSSFENDVGQTVVPYIHLGEVTTHMRTPLSGAGLIHQGNTAKSAGFLGFKLFNYNYVRHLETK